MVDLTMARGEESQVALGCHLKSPSQTVKAHTVCPW